MSLPLSSNERLTAWWGEPLQDSTCPPAWPSLGLRNPSQLKQEETGKNEPPGERRKEGLSSQGPQQLAGGHGGGCPGPRSSCSSACDSMEDPDKAFRPKSLCTQTRVGHPSPDVSKSTEREVIIFNSLDLIFLLTWVNLTSPRSQLFPPPNTPVAASGFPPHPHTATPALVFRRRVNKDTASGMRSYQAPGPCNASTCGQHVPNLNPSVCGHITKARVREVPWDPGHALELKGKKGPQTQSGHGLPSMPGSGHQRVQGCPRGHHSSRPLGGRLSGLETVGFGESLQEPRLWAPRNSRDSPRKRSSHLPELSFCKRQG